MKELPDNLVDEKEDKHWGEIDAEGVQEKEKEEDDRMNKTVRLTRGQRVNEKVMISLTGSPQLGVN